MARPKKPAAALSAEEIERRRLLRKDRNHRFYVKHRQPAVVRTAAASGLARGEASKASLPSSSQSKPSLDTSLFPVLDPPMVFANGVKDGIPIPLTPDVKITAPLEWLNECLRNWGHIDEDPTKFLKTFCAELAAASADPDTLAKFIKAKEIWVEAGDVILDAMQYILGELIIDHLDGEVMRWLWTRVSSAAFKIQYRMTVVEVHLDGLDLDRDDTLNVQ